MPEGDALMATVYGGYMGKVMEIDLERRRISLSMKSAAETLGYEIEVRPMPGAEKAEEEAAPEAAE